MASSGTKKILKGEVIDIAKLTLMLEGVLIFFVVLFLFIAASYLLGRRRERKVKETSLSDVTKALSDSDVLKALAEDLNKASKMRVTTLDYMMALSMAILEKWPELNDHPALVAYRERLSEYEERSLLFRKTK